MTTFLARPTHVAAAVVNSVLLVPRIVSKPSLVLATEGSVATLIAAAAAVAIVARAVAKASALFLASNEAAAVVAVPSDVALAVL